MTAYKFAGALVMAIGLSACGGGGGGSDDGDTFTSEGLLSLQLPRDTSAFPQNAQDLFTEIQDINENGVIEPSPNSTYSGDFLAVIGDYDGGDGTLLTADIAFTVDNNTSTATVVIDGINADDTENGQYSVSGSIINDGDLGLTNGFVTGDVIGSGLSANTQDFSFDGELVGLFATNGSRDVGFGAVEGDLTGPDGIEEAVGLYTVEDQP